MNKRARNRLIIGAAIILVVGAAGLMLSLSSALPMSNVKDFVAQDGKAIGQRAKVVGFVIGESWNGKANPMRFEIKDENAPDGAATLKVVYSGPAPSGFGDKTKATVTGQLNKAGEFEANDMITVCPTKYQTAQAYTVDKLFADKAKALGQVVVVQGYPAAAPSGDTFTMTSRSDGGGELVVTLVGTMPEGIGKGAFVEVTGELLNDGSFRATKVKVNKKAQ